MVDLLLFRWLAPALVFMASCTPEGPYLDHDYPGLTPKKYAPGIINVDGRLQQNLTMSPDGREHLFTVTDSESWRYEAILRVTRDGDETTLNVPPFVADFDYSNERFIGEPMIAPDNQRLFFIANYPPDLWQVQRMENGEWGAPKRMERVSTEKDDWYPTLSQSGNLYFTNGTVLQSLKDGGEYQKATPVNSPFNQHDTRDACISPNEDYIIFTVIDTNSFERSDLFVSFKDADGKWSEARSLGPDINTTHREFAPYISPDERFLFFSRRDQWADATFSNIYWVSLEVIEGLKE